MTSQNPANHSNEAPSQDLHPSKDDLGFSRKALQRVIAESLTDAAWAMIEAPNTPVRVLRMSWSAAWWR